MLTPHITPNSSVYQLHRSPASSKRERAFGSSTRQADLSVEVCTNQAVRRDIQLDLNGDHGQLRDNVWSQSSSSANTLPQKSGQARGPSQGLTQDFPATVRPKSAKDTLMKALAERNWKEAYQEFQSLSETEKASLEGWGVHSKLLAVVSKSQNWRAGWDVFQELKTTRLSYSSLATLLNACIKTEELIRALDVFRDMQGRGMQPNITTWCFLISSLSKSSSRRGWPYAENAYSLWKELESLDYVKGDIDASYYATGILACTRSGNMKEAESILETMSEVGTVNVRTFNMLIKGYGACGNLECMERVVERMKELDIKPIVSTFNSLVNAYSSRLMMPQAQKAMEAAGKAGLSLDIWTYSSLLKGYVKSGDMQGVDSVLDHMKLAGVKPNVVTMTNLLDGCVKAGMMTEAEDLMQSMRAAQIQPNILSYNSLVGGYASTGDVQAVKRVLLQMTEEGISPREDTYNTLMRAALSSRNADRVPELFEQLISLSLRPNSLSYTTLITAFARMQNASNAAGAFRRMKSNIGVDRIALNALICAFANADRMKEAESQLHRAAALADKEGQPPPIEAYGAMVKAYTRQRDVDAAMDCFYEFQERGGEPDEALLNMVITACVRGGEYKRALQFVRSMERAGKNMNKARLKQTLEVVLRLQDQAMRKNKKHVRNLNLERFKFWLGLPNTYYNDSDQLDWNS